MKTVSIESLLEGRTLPRCIKFTIGGVVYSAVRRKRKHFAAQFTTGTVGDIEIHERTIEAGTKVEVVK